MDVKTESKILLTVVALAPTAAGILLAATGESVLGGLLLALLGVVALVWLWWPRKKKK